MGPSIPTVSAAIARTTQFFAPVAHPVRAAGYFHIIVLTRLALSERWWFCINPALLVWRATGLWPVELLDRGGLVGHVRPLDRGPERARRLRLLRRPRV